jgi:hypothetical protein
MAVVAHNGTNYDTVLGTNSMGASNISLTTSYQPGVAQQAPNTTNYITGVIFYLATIPTLGNIDIEVRESGVSKVTVQVLAVDCKLGYNYARFTTPYKFTTTAAGAYQARIKNSSNNSGAVSRDGSGAVPLLAMTYDSIVTAPLSGTHDPMWLGIHDSGLTPINVTLVDGEAFGSGLNKILTQATNRIWGSPVVGNGATVEIDKTVSSEIDVYGNIFVMDGGVFDKRGNASDLDIVSTLNFIHDADGDFALCTASGLYGGTILTDGIETAVDATYNGGAGTVANPAETTTPHGFAIGMEIAIGWGANYLQNEVRWVISIPSPTQIVWSSTKGGAEAALTYTHTTGMPICNMTRNSVIKNSVTTRGFSIYHNYSGSVNVSSFRYTRFEYANCLSGRGLQLSSTGHEVDIDGIVCYNNSASGRTSVAWSGSIEQTSDKIIMFNTKGSNYSAQSGFTLGGSRKTILNLFHYGEPASTTNCAALSANATSTSNRVINLYSSGANAGNGTLGYAVADYGNGNYFENIVIDAARIRGLLLDAGADKEFINCKIGTVVSNTTEVDISSGVLVKAYFENLLHGSGTLLGNYLNTIGSSEIAFQKLNGDNESHRWYTPKGKGRSEPSIVRTGALSLAIEPEDTTDGFTWEFNIPANANLLVYLPTFLRRSAGLTGDVTIDLYLPYSTTPDASTTLDAATGDWITDVTQIDYTEAENLLATVIITVKGTAGNTLYLDDFFNGGNTSVVNNNIASFETWHRGKPAQIFSLLDVSAIPLQAAQLTAAELADDFLEILSNTDATQAKVGDPNF